jgi:hypothetical protein
MVSGIHCWSSRRSSISRDDSYQQRSIFDVYAAVAGSIAIVVVVMKETTRDIVVTQRNEHQVVFANVPTWCFSIDTDEEMATRALLLRTAT